jgi:hypothetical protein
MLNDKQRNAAYRNALALAIATQSRKSTHTTYSSEPPINILDIGGGTGLLSMYAVMEGASRAFCCEMSQPMCSIARDCTAVNNMSSSVNMINKHSSELSRGDCDNSPILVVVSELLDSGVFGEHMLDAFEDARVLLRDLNGGRDSSIRNDCLAADGNEGRCVFIPSDLTIFGVFCHSEELSRRSKIFSPPCRTPASFCDYGNLSKSSISHPLALFTYQHLTDSLFDGIKKRGYDVDETYTCIGSLDGLTVLSDVLRIGKVNLKGYGDVSDGVNIDSHDFVPLVKSAFHSKGNQYVDTFVYWFTCNTITESDTLYDPLKYSFSTSPTVKIDGFEAADKLDEAQQTSGWDVAAFFLHNSCKSTGRGRNCDINCASQGYTCRDCEIQSTYQAAHVGEAVHYSVDASRSGIAVSIVGIDTQDISCEDSLTVREAHTVKLGEMDIALLNAYRRTEAFMFAVLISSCAYVRGFTQAASVNILELGCGCMPIASHVSSLWNLMISRSSGLPLWMANHPVLKCVKEASLEPHKQVPLLSWSTGASPSITVSEASRSVLTSESAVEYSMKCQDVVTKASLENWNVLICDIVDGSGIIKQNILREMQYALSFLSPRSQPSASGRRGDEVAWRRIIPHSVGVVVALVQCPSLVAKYRVRDENTLGVGLFLIYFNGS